MNFDRNQYANRLLLNHCISLYDEIAIIINDLNQDSANFVLKYVSFSGGKVRYISFYILFVMNINE
jgi:hypothetical protein